MATLGAVQFLRMRTREHAALRSSQEMINLGRGKMSTTIVSEKGPTKMERIGSRRGKGGQRKDEVGKYGAERSPFLEMQMRKYKEEGNQVLQDEEVLLDRASNPFVLTLEIAEKANEYLRNNKEASLKRKPILKVISDKINEIHGENIRDSYIGERVNYDDFE